MKKNLLLFIEIAPYLLLAALISIVSDKYSFFEAIATIIAFKWAFNSIDYLVKRFSYKLVGKQKTIDYVLEIFHKNQFPPRENFNDSFDDYISGILYQPEKYHENVIKFSNELEQELSKEYASNYSHYLQLCKALDEALDIYSPKYKTIGLFPAVLGKFDTVVKTNSIQSNIELLNAKNNAFKKVIDSHIDDLLVKLYLASKYYPAWSKREDFNKWNFGVDQIESEKGEILGDVADFVTFRFKGKRLKIGSKPLYGIDTKSPRYNCVEAIKLYFGDDEKSLMEFIFKKKLDDYSVTDFITIDITEYHENAECLELLKIADELIEKHHKEKLKDVKS